MTIKTESHVVTIVIAMMPVWLIILGLVAHVIGWDWAAGPLIVVGLILVF